MHILLTSDAVGGVWTYTLALAQALQRLHVSCTILVLGPAPSSAELKRARSIGLNIICEQAPLEWTASSESDLQQSASIIEAVARKCSAQSIHLHSPAFAAFNPQIPCVAVNHSCVATWWHVMRQGPLPEDLAWRAELNRMGMLTCDELIVPSQSYAQLVQEVYDLPKLPLVIHNGIEIESTRSCRNSAAFIFCAGRLWDEAKNIASLDEIAGLMHHEIHVAGALASPLGGDVGFHHLHSMGNCSWQVVQALLALQPIYISPALFEPFGLSVLEAASHGCALVLNDIPTFRELWEGAAIFVDLADQAYVSKLLEALLEDVPRCQEMGDIARRHASRYSLQACAQSVFAIHHELQSEAVL